MFITNRFAPEKNATPCHASPHAVPAPTPSPSFFAFISSHSGLDNGSGLGVSTGLGGGVDWGLGARGGHALMAKGVLGPRHIFWGRWLSRLRLF